MLTPATAPASTVSAPVRTASWRQTDPRTSIVLLLATSIAVMAPGGELVLPAAVLLGLLLAVADSSWRRLLVLAVAVGVLATLAHLLPLWVAHPLVQVVGVAAAFMLRFAAIIGVAQHLLATATPGTVTTALRAARVPRVVTVPLAVMLRFIPVVVAETLAVIDAMRLHGLTGWRAMVRHPVLSIERFTVPVIAATLRVGDDLTAAALLRGLGSHTRPTSRTPARLGWPDLLWVVVAATLSVLSGTVVGGAR